jgi:hypothetical protein
MDVEKEASHIEEVSVSEISKRPGLKTTIQKLLGSSQCKNTALGQSCTSNKCKLILYYGKKELEHNNVEDIHGFITLLRTSPNTAEIFNLCTAASYTTKVLLEYVIVHEYNVDSLDLLDLWIGLKLESPQFDENVHIFASIGFANPVITKSSPSGINLNYDFIAFTRKSSAVATKDSYKATVDATMTLKSDFFKPKEIKFKTFPAGYKPDMRPDVHKGVAGKIKGENKETVFIKAKTSPKQKSPVKKSPVKKSASPEKKSKEKESIKIIKPVSGDYKNLYRLDKKIVAIQAECLNGFLPKGRLIDKQELSGKTIDEVYEILKQGGYVYEGTYGLVYQACDADNCNYVIKIQIIEGEDAMETWKKEVDLMIKFNEYNIGPKIKSAWVCDDAKNSNQIFGVFAAEKWDDNLGNGDINICPPNHLIDKLENEIATIHKLGYVHGDIMPKNVLVKKDDKGNIVDLTVTDFGTVDTPAEWKRKQRYEDRIETFYKYHVYFGGNERKRIKGFLWPYYELSVITLKDVIKDPALMDNDIVFYLRMKC